MFSFSLVNEKLLYNNYAYFADRLVSGQIAATLSEKQSASKLDLIDFASFILTLIQRTLILSAVGGAACFDSMHATHTPNLKVFSLSQTVLLFYTRSKSLYLPLIPCLYHLPLPQSSMGSSLPVWCDSVIQATCCLLKTSSASFSFVR